MKTTISVHRPTPPRTLRARFKHYCAAPGSAALLLVALPALGQAQVNIANIGVRANQFCFNLTGTNGLVILVEACSNLANPTWAPVATNTLTDGCSFFSDSQSMNHPARFYRVTALITNSPPVDTGFGGTTASYVSNGITYAVHTFTLSSNFHPPANLTHARVLLVGGGGHGGGVVFGQSGGGGGGGEVKDMDIPISGATMAVVVGAAGGSSSFGGQTALPGSAGSDGVAEGDGGGGGASGNGHDGGVGHYWCGGGGGGNGNWGSDAVPNTWNPLGGDGGSGSLCNITGVPQYYGGGGGGGTWVFYSGRNGVGGPGGGGSGGNAAPNTGGGGGGGYWEGGYPYWPGGTGGSGVVIISYPL